MTAMNETIQMRTWAEVSLDNLADNCRVLSVACLDEAMEQRG